MLRSHLVRVLASVVVVVGVGCAGTGDEEGAGEVKIGVSEAAISARAAIDGRARCAVKDPGPIEADAMDAAAEAGDQRIVAQLKGGNEKVRIPVHFHVITDETGFGDVTDLIPAQMDVLNTAFAGSKFSFRLASSRTISSDEWFYAEAGSPEEIEMKVALRRGGKGALNIYSTNGDIYLGWATFPSWYQDDPLYDGVVVYWATLPGTGFDVPTSDPGEPDGFFTYDEGDTGTHEVGHWLGLFHTFQGGCSNPGDRIKDTPAQSDESDAIFYCAQADTCTGRKFPGFDPIHNYMSYGDDQCLFAFTSDQDKRMHKQWNRFRD